MRNPYLPILIKYILLFTISNFFPCELLLVARTDKLGSVGSADNHGMSKNLNISRHGQLIYYSFDGEVPYCTPSSEFILPRSTQEIQSLVRNAVILRQTLKAVGQRHSTTDIICTDGIPLDMRNFNEMRLNQDLTATFGAGVLAGEASKFLMGKGRAFIHVAGYDGITIGGALTTGAHGSSLLHPASFSEQVVQVKIVDGLGILRTISGIELDAFRVNLGVLGIIIDVTMSSFPLFKMTIEAAPYRQEILLDGKLTEMAGKFDFFQVAWFPATSMVVVTKGVYTEDFSLPGYARWTLFPETEEHDAIKERDVTDALQASRNVAGFKAIQENVMLSSYDKVVGRTPIFTEDGDTLSNPGVGYGFQLMSASCVKCDWYYGANAARGGENSVGCPLKELPAIVNTIMQLLVTIPPALLRIQIRFHPPAKGLLSIAHNRPTVIFGFLFTERTNPNEPKTGLGFHQAVMQVMIDKHDCRPHWGKGGLSYHTHEVMKRTIPAPIWTRFASAIYYYDPLGVFRNKFSNRLLGLASAVDSNPAQPHCALLETCICSRDGDCGVDQTCSDLVDPERGQTYKICMDVYVYENKPLRPYDPYNYSSILEAIFY